MTNNTIFLCHASEDKLAVLEVYNRLKAEGLSPWIDKIDLLPGQRWDEEIPRIIKTSAFVLIFFSEKSASKRGYVQKEFELALQTLQEIPERQIYIIPVRLNNCQIPQRFSHLHYCDLFEKGGTDRVIETIKTQFRVLSHKSSVELPLADKKKITRRRKATSPKALSVLTNDKEWQWVVNLSLGYSAYLKFSASIHMMSTKDYINLTEMVTVPCQELGLEVSILPKLETTAESALALSETIKSELRLRNTRLSSTFDFLYRIFLLLNSNNHTIPWSQEELQEGQKTLELLARNSGLLDHYSQRLIKSLLNGDMSEKQRESELHIIIKWASQH